MRIWNKRTDRNIPKTAVYVGRPTPWGNPFVIGRHGDRKTVIAKYRRWLWKRMQENRIDRQRLADLAGKDLRPRALPRRSPRTRRPMGARTAERTVAPATGPPRKSRSPTRDRLTPPPSTTPTAGNARARRLRRRRRTPVAPPPARSPRRSRGPNPFLRTMWYSHGMEAASPHTLRTYGALIAKRALVMPFPAQTTTNAAWVLPEKCMPSAYAACDERHT